MANYEMPRRGSAAFNALNGLSNVGGFLSVDSWLRLLDWRGSKERFIADVIGHLKRSKLVFADADVCRVTDAGRRYLGLKVEELNGDADQLAGRRYVAPERPLDIARHFPPRVDRAGSLDHRAIPSLMASQRVAYRASAADKQR